VQSIESSTDAISKAEKVNDVLKDLRGMKRAQIDMSTQMNQIRQENDTLFDDVSWIREKMEAQQNVLDKVGYQWYKLLFQSGDPTTTTCCSICVLSKFHSIGANVQLWNLYYIFLLCILWVPVHWTPLELFRPYCITVLVGLLFIITITIIFYIFYYYITNISTFISTI